MDAGRGARSVRALAVRLATWNVNSVRARADRVVDWLVRADVDVLAMQETKCSDDQFPAMAFLAAGTAMIVGSLLKPKGKELGAAELTAMTGGES